MTSRKVFIFVCSCLLTVMCSTLSTYLYAHNPCSSCNKIQISNKPSSDAGNQITVGNDNLLYFRSSLIAFAKIRSDGSIARGIGITSVHHVAGSGRYTINLASSRSTQDYIINLTAVGANTAGKNDANIYIPTGTQDYSHFQVAIDSNDDGSSSGKPVDSEFMLSVYDYD